MYYRNSVGISSFQSLFDSLIDEMNFTTHNTLERIFAYHQMVHQTVTRNYARQCPTTDAKELEYRFWPSPVKLDAELFSLQLESTNLLASLSEDAKKNHKEWVHLYWRLDALLKRLMWKDSYWKHLEANREYEQEGGNLDMTKNRMRGLCARVESSWETDKDNGCVILSCAQLRAENDLFRKRLQDMGLRPPRLNAELVRVSAQGKLFGPSGKTSAEDRVAEEERQWTQLRAETVLLLNYPLEPLKGGREKKPLAPLKKIIDQNKADEYKRKWKILQEKAQRWLEYPLQAVEQLKEDRTPHAPLAEDQDPESRPQRCPGGIGVDIESTTGPRASLRQAAERLVLNTERLCTVHRFAGSKVDPDQFLSITKEVSELAEFIYAAVQKEGQEASEREVAELKTYAEAVVTTVRSVYAAHQRAKGHMETFSFDLATLFLDELNGTVKDLEKKLHSGPRPQTEPARSSPDDLEAQTGPPPRAGAERRGSAPIDPLQGKFPPAPHSRAAKEMKSGWGKGGTDVEGEAGEASNVNTKSRVGEESRGWVLEMIEGPSVMEVSKEGHPRNKGQSSKTPYERPSAKKESYRNGKDKAAEGTGAAEDNGAAEDITTAEVIGVAETLAWLGAPSTALKLTARELLAVVAECSGQSAQAGGRTSAAQQVPCPPVGKRRVESVGENSDDETTVPNPFRLPIEDIASSSKQRGKAPVLDPSDSPTGTRASSSKPPGEAPVPDPSDRPTGAKTSSSKRPGGAPVPGPSERATETRASSSKPPGKAPVLDPSDRPKGTRASSLPRSDKAPVPGPSHRPTGTGASSIQRSDEAPVPGPSGRSMGIRASSAPVPGPSNSPTGQRGNGNVSRNGNRNGDGQGGGSELERVRSNPAQPILTYEEQMARAQKNKEGKPRHAKKKDKGNP
jgi:hypothetical protein